MRLIRVAVFIATAAALVGACTKAPSSEGLISVPTPSASPASSAPASPGGPELPDLTFATVAQARAQAVSRHFRLVISGMTTMRYLPGTVLAQSPKPGTLLRRGQVVKLTISQAPACDPSYPTVCLPPFRPDLTCKDITARNFPVRPPDDDHFDRDHDGIGCPHVIRVKASP